jgi:cytochrome b
MDTSDDETMTASHTAFTTVSRTTATVWDPLVRLGHWALVAAFAVAYFSAEEEEAGAPDALHAWGGYFVGGIVALRVVWGFVGPRYARFSDFVCGPLQALGYLKDLLLGRAQRYIGHSPAGGAMVIALLVCLAATVATGLVAYGEQGKGPLAARPATVSVAQANSKEAKRALRLDASTERSESVTGEVHGILANITLALVILHILGVGLASVVHRENLVVSMITGRKRTEGPVVGG